MLQPLVHGALDLLFPPRCAACNRFGSRFCASCLDRVEPLLPPICRRCGRPRPSGGMCPACRQASSSLDGIRSASLFDEPLRSAIHHFKYRGARELSHPLASLLLDCWQRYSLSADVLVPVALHRRRLRERGYNQSALLARDLGALCQRSVDTGVLLRERDTLPQVTLNAQQRRLNVAGAFHCTSGAMRGHRVVLVDDVCTSGATLEACATALRCEGQATSVWAITVARARGLDDRTYHARPQSLTPRDGRP